MGTLLIGITFGLWWSLLWMAAASALLILWRSGRLGWQEVKVVQGVRPRDFERAVNRETRDGWRLTSLVDKVCYEFGKTEPHRELDVVLVKWRLT